ncbi:hypothetical protein C2845_PM13G20590 [Panicum miliaceum]|uniref:Uncharacterized protein n=1 Tax=Panicum miliaceum TaxID=4540 RepID=A0A3L6RKA7_PANMI|nr:hypothetical protein C2845_PM13G20590 [Panicum miliaceum]
MLRVHSRCLEAARLSVVGLADGGDRVGELEELLQRDAETGGDGLVALGDAHPSQALVSHLSGLLLELSGLARHGGGELLAASRTTWTWPMR